MSFPQSTSASPYGPKLSQAAYEQKMTSFSVGLPPIPTRAQERGVRLSELNTLIDYKLGVNFPVDRREALWAIQQRLDKRRLLHLAIALLTAPFDGFAGVARPQVRGFAKVLSPSELAQFFDLSADEVAAFL